MANWMITGVSSGLGKALARTVLDRGERVFGTVRSPGGLEAFKALAPGRSSGALLDVTDTGVVLKVAAAAEAELGGIDILVHNAGYGLVGGVEETGLDEARAQFETNFFGAMAVFQAVLPFMRSRRAGRIIVVSSVSGLVGWPSLGVYSASKFALEGLCETLAEEVRPLGIMLSLVEPGGLRTDFATRSRISSTHEIADYAETVGACRQILADHAGHETGDPDRAAWAIAVLAQAATPPLRLLLGADALSYAEGKFERQRAEIDAWREVTLSIGYSAP